MSSAAMNTWLLFYPSPASPFKALAFCCYHQDLCRRGLQAGTFNAHLRGPPTHSSLRLPAAPSTAAAGFGLHTPARRQKN